MGEWRGPARFIGSDAAGVGDRYRSGIEEGGGEKYGEGNGGRPLWPRRYSLIQPRFGQTDQNQKGK